MDKVYVCFVENNYFSGVNWLAKISYHFRIRVIS